MTANGPGWHDAWMACRDGTRLVSRIWTPQGEGPWPALLMRQPYGRAIASTVTYAHPSWYSSHGFLVVVQDVRGRGESEGDFLGFSQEASDGADAVGWVRQLPQCNGRIGTYGFSYQGLSQLLNDGSALPDCLAPAMAGIDERSDWASEGGAHWWALGLGWGLQLAAQRCARHADGDGWQRIRRSLEAGSFCHEGLALLERYDPDGMALAWLRQDPGCSEGWTCHAVAPALLQRPMLLLGGWHDPHLRGLLDLWALSRAAGGSPMLRIGAWSHLHWPGGADAIQLAFFQHHLQHAPLDCGSEHTNMTPIALQERPLGPWHSHELAELSGLTGPCWQLNGDQGTIVHDPWRPVPGRGGHLDSTPGRCERSDLDQRRDVACFTTAPLQQSLRLLGRPRLTIPVVADQPGFDLCVCLSQVVSDAGGGISSVRQLSTGVARFLGASCLQSMDRLIFLQPVMADLQPGDRLRLSIAASAWPQIALNPGDGSMPMGGPSYRHRVITLSFDLGLSQLSIEPLLGAPPCASSQLRAN